MHLVNRDKCARSKFVEVCDDFEFMTTTAVCKMPRLKSRGLSVSGRVSHCAVIDGGRLAKHSNSRE